MGKIIYKILISILILSMFIIIACCFQYANETANKTKAVKNNTFYSKDKEVKKWKVF